MSGFKKEYVWTDSQSFAQGHASTLVELANGDLLCSFFAGSREGQNDVGIYWARRSGNSWGNVTLAAKVAHVPHWNPVLFRGPDGTVFLFFKVGKSIKQWKTFVRRSHDGGATWREPEELVLGDDSGGRGPVKNKPIMLSDGTIAAPASKEVSGWYAFVDLSRDGGKTWERSIFVPEVKATIKGKEDKVGVIQPTLWESAPGKVHMLLRSNAGQIYRSDSNDGGRTWGTMYPTGLVHNNSGIDLVKLVDGRLVLAHNPTTYWRNKLVLSVSGDNGANWQLLEVLEDKPDNVPENEYSYPSVILKQNGSLAVCYTYERKTVAIVDLNPNCGAKGIK
jgi:predicted neuraminidase